jgi:hypothetical protein
METDTRVKCHKTEHLVPKAKDQQVWSIYLREIDGEPYTMSPRDTYNRKMLPGRWQLAGRNKEGMSGKK